MNARELRLLFIVARAVVFVDTRFYAAVVPLFAPSTSPFFAYSHLVAAAWWTLVWHLRRYVGASLRASFRSKHSPDLPLERRDVCGEDVPCSLGVPG